METKVLDILKDTLELDVVNESCSQEDCTAWDLMGQLNLVVELEDTFGASLEPEEIGSTKSYGDTVRILKSKGVEQ